jgi:hypothetical protein
MARRPPVAERADQRSPVRQVIERALAEFAERGVNTVPLPADALAAIDRVSPEDAAALHEIDQIIVSHQRCHRAQQFGRARGPVIPRLP